MRKLWNKIVAWFLAIPTDKRLHFVCGFIISAFFALSLKMTACIVPAIAAGFIKEFFDSWTGGKWDWLDLLATALGGLLCQAFVVLGLWWF